MAHKMIIAMQIQADLSEFTVGVNDPPWLDMGKYDPRPMGEWLEKNIYAGDKVSIIFPDTYIDLAFMAISPQERGGIMNDFSQCFMECSKRPSRNGVVQVREKLKHNHEPRYPMKAPPLCIMFMVKGSSEMTTGMWSAILNQMCGFKGHHHNNQPLVWPYHLQSQSESFKSVVEKCFGFKFTDSGFETTCVLESIRS